MDIINLTPHAVTLIQGEAGSIVIEPARVAARVTSDMEVVGQVEGIPLVRQSLGEVEGLPAQQQDTLLIVSRMVAAAAPDRNDLVVPADLVRDNQGRIIGCRALERC